MVIGSVLVALAGFIAYSPILWANWQISQGMDYRGAWTTVAVLGIFVWGIAAIVATVGIVVALRRPAPKK
ncbi:MAG: hypothetical protein ACKOWP_02310 [Microbacteriaceae bacterium]